MVKEEKTGKNIRNNIFHEIFLFSLNTILKNAIIINGTVLTAITIFGSAGKIEKQTEMNTDKINGNLHSFLKRICIERKPKRTEK
jgi:hypothetical protein